MKSPFLLALANTKPMRKFGAAVTAITFISMPLSPLVSFAAVETPSNPPLEQSCGLDIALVLDSSGSIDASELATMKSAFHDFVNTFLPGTPTLFSVTDFDSTAHTPTAFTSDLTVINAAIDAPTSGGSTNWQDALTKAQSTFDPRPSVPNLVIFASDGQPNRTGNPSSSVNQATAVANAVTVADSIKSSGTRILVLGIGTGGNSGFIDNLKAISGPNVDMGATSDVITTDFATLASDLAQVAQEQCGGTITATKIIDRDGNPETTNDQSPGVGWAINVAGTAETTDDQGKTHSIAVTGSGPFSVIETPTSGYTFVSASCTNTNHGNVAVGSAATNGISGISLTDQDIISCVIYNKPASGTLHVVKNIVNDNDVAPGTVTNPADFELHVHEATTSQANPFETQTFAGAGTPGTDISLPGDTSYVVEEDPQANPAGYAPSFSEGCTGTMPINGDVTCTVTNNDIPSDMGSLTVLKSINKDNGGTADVASFAPYTVTPTEGAPVTVTVGQAMLLAPGTYTVAETNDPEHYSQSFSATCPSGVVTVVAGQSVTCVITNDDIPATLTIVKTANGGDGSFNFTVKQGETTVNTVAVGTSGGTGTSNDVSLNVGSYDVQEVAQSGWTFGSASCVYDNQSVGNTITNGENISVGLGSHVTCTFVNNVVAPPAACSDEQDNDGDGLVDANDPGCHSDGNAGNSESYVPSDNDESDGSDMCPNIDGVQLTVPSDQQLQNGLCVPKGGTQGGGGGPSGGGGGNGPIAGSQGGGGGGGPIAGTVLGASTSTVPEISCDKFIDKFVKKGGSNDPLQVVRVQYILKAFENMNVPISGIFDDMTYNAVMDMQNKYAGEVLTPWGLDHPTGFVYLTTRKKLNEIYCKGTRQFPLTSDEQSIVTSFKASGAGHHGSTGGGSSSSGGSTGGGQSGTGSGSSGTGSEAQAGAVGAAASSTSGGGGGFWGFVSNLFHH